MMDKKSVLAKVMKEYQARKTAREAEAIQNEVSSETANLAPNKTVSEKVQGVKKLKPKPNNEERPKPPRVRPRECKKTEGTTEAEKLSVVQLKQRDESAVRIPKRQDPFEKRYRRVTTYLENGVNDKIQHLYEKGEIDRISNLINTAIKLYLIKHYRYSD